jgi:hypothetical protein
VRKHLSRLQEQVVNLGREVTGVSIAETPNTPVLVSFMHGPPVLLSVDGTVQEVPSLPGGRMFGKLHRRGGFIAVATEKGLICLLAVASLKVLDALQVWFPCSSSNGTDSGVLVSLGQSIVLFVPHALQKGDLFLWTRLPGVAMGPWS